MNWEQQIFVKFDLDACGWYRISPCLDMAAATCEIGAPYQHYGRIEVYSLADDSQAVLLEKEEREYNFWGLEWSPDGKWLSFFLTYPERGPTNNNLGRPDAGFYFLDADCLLEPTTCLEKLHGPFQIPAYIVAGSYSWSPDSRFIAFTSSRIEGFENLM